MPKIVVSDAVLAAIRQASVLPYNETAVRITPGWNEVPIENETMELMNKHREENETDDSLLRRFFELPQQATN